MKNTGKTLVTRAKAAEIYGITVRTIDRWATAGVIKKYENQVGHVRVCLEELEKATGSYREV